MKYKVGDKVKIREDLNGDISYKSENNSRSGYLAVHEMLLNKGKNVTITETVKYNIDHYKIKEDNGKWKWTDEMFEGLVSEVENKKNIKEKNMKDFKIKDYKVYENRAVIVEFEDGTKEKAVCCELDTFDLERGIEICVLKHIFGADGYKSVLKTSLNQIKAVDKAKEDKKKLEESIAKKKAKAARRKARRLENKRKERVTEMKEAFLSEMKDCFNGEFCNRYYVDGFDELK